MLRELDYRQSVETMSKDLKELGVSLWHSFKASTNSKIRRRNKQARFLGWQWKSSKDTSTKQWFKIEILIELGLEEEEESIEHDI